MIRKKIFKTIPALLALGVILNVSAVNVSADVVNLNADMLIDNSFFLDPVITVNNKNLNKEDMQFDNGQVYLNIESVVRACGEFLEGDFETEYYLRKADKMAVIIPSENKYVLNGKENNLDAKINDNKLFVNLKFIQNVLGYSVVEDGNNYIIKSENKADNNNVTCDNNVDSNMLVKQEIYINSEKYPDFGTFVFDSKTYLPLDVVSSKMGDILEGSVENEAYYLRKADKLVVIGTDGNYKVNNETGKIDTKIINGHLYVPVVFFKNVLGYKETINGNSIYIGEVKNEEKLADTINNARWQCENGVYYLYDGSTLVTGWARQNNKWYFMDSNGAMKTGWLNVNNKWYFLNNDGSMATGWINSKDNNYYLNKDGSMAANTEIDGFKISDNGIAISLY